jgi:uncharacterized protein (DUF1330 family)
MSERPVYVLANFIVEDSERYRKYEKGFFPILNRYDGEFIAYDDNSRALEKGDLSLSGRLVLFKFPSEEKALQWYEDPDYQLLSGHRRASTKLQFLNLMHC